jgi:chromosome partitioning protein
MFTIAVAAGKGGPGKTTLAINLATVAAQATGRLVGIWDLDPQRTTETTWFGARPEHLENPAPIMDVGADQAAGFFGALRAAGQMGLAIIDTPPAQDHLAAVELGVGLADHVLIPVRPSLFDVAAIGLTVGICRAAGKPYTFVASQVVAKARETAEVVAALSEHGRVCPKMLGLRQTFITAAGEGLGVVEWDKRSKAAEEIRALWEWLEHNIARNGTKEHAA